MSAVAVTLFFGGWHGLGLVDLDRLPPWLQWYKVVAPTAIFFSKQLVLMLSAIWVRGTLPRLRYDQLMDFGWKVMVPVAGCNLVVVAISYAVVNRWF